MVIQVYCSKTLYLIFGVAADGTTFSRTPNGHWVESSQPLKQEDLDAMVFVSETTIRV